MQFLTKTIFLKKCCLYLNSPLLLFPLCIPLSQNLEAPTQTICHKVLSHYLFYVLIVFVLNRILSGFKEMSMKNMQTLCVVHKRAVCTVVCSSFFFLLQYHSSVKVCSQTYKKDSSVQQPLAFY